MFCDSLKKLIKTIGMMANVKFIKQGAIRKTYCNTVLSTTNIDTNKHFKGGYYIRDLHKDLLLHNQIKSLAGHVYWQSHNLKKIGTIPEDYRRMMQSDRGGISSLVSTCNMYHRPLEPHPYRND